MAKKMKERRAYTNESRRSAVEHFGSGQMGMILLDFQWNSIRSQAGWAEVARPIYDQKLVPDHILLGVTPLRDGTFLLGGLNQLLRSSKSNLLFCRNIL